MHRLSVKKIGSECDAEILEPPSVSFGSNIVCLYYYARGTNSNVLKLIEKKYRNRTEPFQNILIFKKVPHSMNPSKTPSISVSHKVSNHVQLL